MTTEAQGIISYAGTALQSQIISPSWYAIGIMFPDTGRPPTMPQFTGETLQPPNVDGARYRLGGAHFPKFRMFTVMGVVDYDTAAEYASQIELCRADFIQLLWHGTTYRLYVDQVVAQPRPFPVSGDVQDIAGAINTAYACVDTQWVAQVAPT